MGEESTRQDDLEELLASAAELPDATDVLVAYEELQQAMAWNLMELEDEARCATGANA